MVKGDHNNYNDPEQAKQLRELRAGGLARPPGAFKPSKEQPPLPFVEDKNGSEIAAGDRVKIDDFVYKVRAVDVNAKKVDIGSNDWILATDCVGYVRDIEELVQDGLLPEAASPGGRQHAYYRGRFYDSHGHINATHRDYRFCSSVLSARRNREKRNEQKKASLARVAARRKDEDDAPHPRYGDAEMRFRHSARHAKRYVAAILDKCPCKSGLDVQWCNMCDLPGSGKTARACGVTAPLRGPTSDDSFLELVGMSREDFDKYRKACMHPAPPEVVQELLDARRILFDTPVCVMELEHAHPKSAYQRAVGQMIGFAADGKTPNKAAKGAYLFCELQLMFHADNARKGRGFSDDLRRLYEERLLCCMSPRSLAFYKVDRLDPRVTFFKIDTIVRKLKAWGEARAKELGSEVFVPIGAKAGWLARARVTMAEDARAIRAWQRDRGEAVDDEDEEEAAVDEHERQAAARERAARCVEIKAERRAADRAARDKEAREAQPRGRAFRQALRELSPAAPTRRRRRLPVDARVSAFYWQWRCHVPATVVEVRGDGDVDVKFYDGERCVVPADLVRSLEPDVSYARGEVVEAFCAEDQQFHRAMVARCRRDDLYEVAFDHTSGGAVLPSQLLRKPPPRRRPAPPPPRPPPPPPRDVPPPPRPPPRRSQRLVPAPPPPPRRKRPKRGGK